jgi:hypothetical protein
LPFQGKKSYLKKKNRRPQVLTRGQQRVHDLHQGIVQMKSPRQRVGEELRKIHEVPRASIPESMEHQKRTTNRTI